jgi:hypothetical protein
MANEKEDPSVSMTRRPTTARRSRTRTRAQANGQQSPPPAEPGLDLEIVTVTPELAQGWLDRGGTNRKTTRRRIEAMTAAIQRGEWRLTGEAIKLDYEGRVRDGQNRLHAIVEAGIPVRSVVARGVSEDAFDVMDTGRSRNAADVLHIHGYPSQNALAAAARGLMFVERYGRVFPSQRDSHLYVTPVTTLQYVQNHPEIVSGVHLGDRIYHSGIQGGIGLWAIVMTLFFRLDPEQAEQFTEHLTTGAGLRRGHPLLMLRNRLLGSQRDQYSTLSGREALVAIAIKAWNAWREGKTLQALTWRAEGRRAEPFPEAI